MMKVQFPIKKDQRYYDIHYRYVLEIFRHVGADIEFKDGLDIDKLRFMMNFNGCNIIIDFADDKNDIMDSSDGTYPYFKFHTTTDKTIPFSPISFYDWNKKYDIKYSANGDRIINCQKPYGNALERRKNVHDDMKFIYGEKFDTTLTNQDCFFNKINDCLVAVFVGGQNNNMIDRSHMQFMRFGCPFITTMLPEILPFDKRLVPDEHYIMCKDDFSDLQEKIEWCKDNRKRCVEIGQNAQNLFNETSTPEKLERWVNNELELFG